jgi:hypothetical protein
VSGLKVNFLKSFFMGVNVNDFRLNEATSVLNCKFSKLPIVYLGMSIGGNKRHVSFWEPVLNRINSRLSE